MPLLNTAKAVYVGTTPATAIYQGTVKVWPPAPSYSTEPFNGLTNWTVESAAAGSPTASGTLQLPFNATINVESRMTSNFVTNDVWMPVTHSAISRRFMEMRLGTDTNNYVRIGVYKTDIYASRCVAGVNTDYNYITAGYNPTTHKWWRITNVGGTATIYTSPDGTNWTQYVQITHTLDLSAATVSITWGNGSSQVAGANTVVDDLYYVSTGAFADNFNRADGPLTGWRSTINGAPAWNISGQQVTSPATAASVVYDRDLGSPNNFSEAEWLARTGSMHWLCRSTGTTPENFYSFRIGNTDGACILYRVVSGAFTSIASGVTVTLQAPFRGRIEARGSLISGYWNGVKVIEVTDTAITAGNFAGLRSSVSGNVMDNWRGGSL